MSFLFIVLASYSSAGEALFVGVLSGLFLWGVMELIQFIKNRKQK